MSLTQNWNQQAQETELGVICRARRPRMVPAGHVLVRGLRGLAGTCSQACVGVLAPSDRRTKPGQPAARPGDRGLARSPGVWVAAGGSEGQTSCVLAAPARPRPRDVHPMAGGGQAHPAVCQPQGRPPEGGHSVRSLLLTRGLRAGPPPEQAWLACPRSLGDVGCTDVARGGARCAWASATPHGQLDVPAGRARDPEGSKVLWEGSQGRGQAGSSHVAVLWVEVATGARQPSLPLLNQLAASACGRSWPPPGHTFVSSTAPTRDASV